MAKFVGAMPDDLIKMFADLELNTDKMLGDMVTAGAKVAEANVVLELQAKEVTH